MSRHKIYHIDLVTRDWTFIQQLLEQEEKMVGFTIRTEFEERPPKPKSPAEASEFSKAFG